MGPEPFLPKRVMLIIMKCVKCGSVCKSFDSLGEHLDVMHKITKYPRLSLNTEECSSCMITPKTKHLMQIHKNGIHGKDTLIPTCKHCLKSFNNDEEFKSHLADHKTIKESYETSKPPEYYEYEEEIKDEKIKVEEFDISPVKDTKNDITKLEVKRYLCPVGFCTFSVDANDELSRRNHIKVKHNNTKFDSIKFMTL